MPIKKSAKKALRKSERKRERNLRKKTAIKTLLKKFKEFISQKNVEEAKKILPLLQKAIDKAVKCRILKKGKGNRLKSKIYHSLNEIIS